MKTQEGVSFKGTREGILILLDEQDDFDAVLSQLREKLDGAGDFFQGGGAIVDVGRRELTRDEYAALVHVLQDEHALALLRVVANLPERNRPNGRKGVTVLRRLEADDICELEEEQPQAQPPKPQRTTVRQTLHPQEVEDSTLFVHRTLRSGQRVNYDGSVVIIGDVNPGAEVVASGDILVMGALRGLAHAGARGSALAKVVAFCLAPMQLRIASFIARAPDEGSESGTQPEQAVIKDGMLVIEPYLD